MAKFTLLQMTQNILSAMSSDEVNSISDSPESIQIANIIQNKYYDILSRGALPDDKNLIQFTDFGDPTRPVIMTIPSGVASIDWIKYYDSNPLDGTDVSIPSHGVNTDITEGTVPLWSTVSTTSNTVSTGSKTFTVSSGLSVTVGGLVQAISGSNQMYGTLTSYSGTTMVLNITAVVGSGTLNSWIISGVTQSPPGYRYVTILPLTQFLDYINDFNLTDDNVLPYTFTQGGVNFNFLYKNDRQPSFCTIVSNDYILFDSYDNTQDTTIQASKTMAWGQQVPTFSLTDSFIPEIDDNQFPLLINEAKALAFFELKQMAHPKAEQELRRQWSTVQKNKSLGGKPTPFDQLANFGRIPRTGGYGGSTIRNYRYWR